MMNCPVIPKASSRSLVFSGASEVMIPGALRSIPNTN